MTERAIEKAKLFHVSGPIDRPERTGAGISVMFNPSSLKVTLANAIGENQRGSNSRAAQYVDKSSSSLTVELIFDSSIEIEEQLTEDQQSTIDVRKDVRKYTGEIANEFMKQESVGDKQVEPKRCMFLWGTFKFVGIMEGFDETLDFFSWEGTPLRSTVSIKMTESRFQFDSEAAKEARRRTPRLGRDNEAPHEAATSAGQDPKNWRDTSMYNGVESPRMPSSSSLAVPSLSASAGLSASVGASAGMGISGGVGFSASAGIGASAGFSASAGFGGGISGSAGIGISAGVSASASVSGGLSASVSSASIMKSTPAFSFGASSSIGTGIPGAFSPNTKISGGLTAGNLLAISVSEGGATRSSTRVTSGYVARTQTSSRVSATASVQVTTKGVKASGSLGFD